MRLSRVADSLYWISRYLERAEHAARVVGVAVDLRLGRVSGVATGPVERLYGSLGLGADAAVGGARAGATVEGSLGVIGCGAGNPARPLSTTGLTHDGLEKRG